MSAETITEIKLDEKLEQDVKPPKKYKVILLNDDRTPMEWVVGILIEVFKHDSRTAKELTMSIHNDGSGVAGIYSFEVAESKTNETITASRNAGFPLRVKLEEE